MSESPSLDVNKTKALELANQLGGTHAEVVARANAYHEYLTGKGTGKPAAAAAAAAPGKPAAAPKATPASGTKPAAPAKPAAATPKPAAATPKPAAAPAAGGAPKGDTKDPKGNNTYDDVVAALRKVMASIPNENKKNEGRKLAYDILAAKGDGIKLVRDLKPALYDAVVAGCEEAAKKGGAAKPAAAAAPKAAAAPTVVEDDLGQEVDTSGAGVETAGADDPPEGGSGDEDA